MPTLPGAGAQPKSLKPFDHSTPGVQSPWMMLATLLPTIRSLMSPQLTLVKSLLA